MANNKLSHWSLALLRIVLGIIFAYHGYLKLFVIGGLPGTAKFFASVGIPYSNYFAVIVAFAEFFGGLFLLLGMLTKWSTLVLIVNMSVAFFVVHLKNGFLISNGGYEFVLILLASLVVILASGPGRLSLGKLFKKKWMQ